MALNENFQTLQNGGYSGSFLGALPSGFSRFFWGLSGVILHGHSAAETQFNNAETVSRAFKWSVDSGMQFIGTESVTTALKQFLVVVSL